jgi:transglutaminase-like putative cysteine protease
MSWEVSVRHQTGYVYEAAVSSSYNEARMTPLTSPGQRTLDVRLEVSPKVDGLLRYTDYWGTRVDAFDVHERHTELLVSTTSVVETGRSLPPDETEVGWDVLARADIRDRHAEMLAPSRLVVVEDEVNATAAVLARGLPPLQAGLAAVRWAHDSLTHGRGATTVRTTSAEARVAAAGVCQDFAHIALAMLRAMQLPARYVSGYLYAAPEADIGVTVTGESHAWVEFWAGRWIAADPSNLMDVVERHVLVARGRDYADVRPLAGIYQGAASHALDVVVELTRLR